MIKYIILLLLITIVPVNAEIKEVRKEKLIIAGPLDAVSHPVFHMIGNDSLKDFAKTTEFRLWKNQDQLKALVLKGDIDFIALPANAAVNFYNKGIDLKFINVVHLGKFGIVSNSKNLKEILQLKGQAIAIPARGGMSDIVFKNIIKKQNINSKKDLRIIYTSSPLVSLNMLLQGKVDNAFLPNSLIVKGLLKSKELYFSIDIQEAWKKAMKTNAPFPKVGFAVLGKNRKKTELIEKFLNEYEKAVIFYIGNKDKSSILVEKNLKMLKAGVVKETIDLMEPEILRAKDMKKDILDFYKILYQFNPKSIGGKLPDENFF